MHHVVGLVACGCGSAVPVAAAGTILAARTVIARGARGAVVAVEPRTVITTRSVITAAPPVAAVEAATGRAVIAVEPRTLTPLVPIEARTVIAALGTVETALTVAVEATASAAVIALGAGTVAALAVIALEARTLIPTVEPAASATVIAIETRTVPALAVVTIESLAVVALEPRTLGAVEPAASAGTVVAARAVVEATLAPPGEIPPGEAAVAEATLTETAVIAVVTVVRRFAATGLGAVADRAGLVATRVLLLGPAALGCRPAGLGGAVAAVLRADAAGAAVGGATLAGIRSPVVGPALFVAAEPRTRVTVVERRLLRVSRLEVAGRTSALGLAVLRHGGCFLTVSDTRTASAPCAQSQRTADIPGHPSAGAIHVMVDEPSAPELTRRAAPSKGPARSGCSKPTARVYRSTLGTRPPHLAVPPYDGDMPSDETSRSPTGIQIHLRRGDVTAQIAQVGASLRHLTVGGVEIVPPYPEDEPTPLCSGAVLAPWPNRIRDGVWQDGETTRALAITEPKFRNASHGLLRFTAYEIVERTEAAVTLAAAIVPQTGYPYLVETTVRYTLTDAGIDVVHTLTNRSAQPAAVALGTHPFLTIGDVDARDLVLRIPAETYFETDERMLPIGESPVSSGTDLREGRRLGELQLDTGFANLHRDADGMVRSTLTAPDGRTVTLQQGAGLTFVQAFTTDRYPGRPLVVAIEPMTAPAEAFNSGRGLRHLAQDESWTLEWGIRFS